MNDELKSRSQNSEARMIKAAPRCCLSLLLDSEFWILTPALLHHSSFIIHHFVLFLGWRGHDSSSVMEFSLPVPVVFDPDGAVSLALRAEARSVSFDQVRHEGDIAVKIDGLKIAQRELGKIKLADSLD